MNWKEKVIKNIELMKKPDKRWEANDFYNQILYEVIEMIKNMEE